MKANVLRINGRNLNENENIYNLDYNDLIKNKVLTLVQSDEACRYDVTEIYQDDFNFLRITTKFNDKYIIAMNQPIDLNKDLKTQQVKDVLGKLEIYHKVSLEMKKNNYALVLGDSFLYEYPSLQFYYSKDNESLDDFILRIGKEIVNNK